MNNIYSTMTEIYILYALLAIGGALVAIAFILSEILGVNRPEDFYCSNYTFTPPRW